jgi:uncharacterized Zn finger protein
MTYKCPKCGEDVTAQVLRKRMSSGTHYRSRFSPGSEPQPEPVAVTCSKGHTHLF